MFNIENLKKLAETIRKDKPHDLQGISLDSFNGMDFSIKLNEKTFFSKFDKSNLISLKEGNQKEPDLFFIDGSILDVLDIMNFKIYKIRLGAVSSSMRKLIIKEGYVYKKENDLKVFGNLKEICDDLSFKKELDDSEILNFCESRFLYLLSNKFRDSIFVKDGTLQELLKMIDFKSFNIEKNLPKFIGISKKSGLKLGKWNATAIMKFIPGRWIYKNALNIGNLKLGLVKPLDCSLVYRIDYFDDSLIDFIPFIFKNVIPKIGYPFGLMDIHNLVVIREKEVSNERKIISSLVSDDLIDLHDIF